MYYYLTLEWMCADSKKSYIIFVMVLITTTRSTFIYEHRIFSDPYTSDEKVFQWI